MLLKSIPFSLMVVVGGLLVAHFNSIGQKTDISTFPIVIPLCIGALIFGLYSGIRRQKEVFDSYILTVDHLGVTREQKNFPTIAISNEEIAEIKKNSNGSIILKGKFKGKIIFIPAQIDDYEKLEGLLSEKGQILVNSKEAFLQKFQWLFSILTLGIIAVLFISKDKIIVGVSGAVLLFILCNALFDMLKNKIIDNKTKMGMWWLVLVMVSIAVVVFYKII